MATTEQGRLAAVHHVVHEYANLESSGKMVLTGKHLGKNLDPPVNTHVQHAFLLNCRKMAHFFGKRVKDDVTAADFLENQSVTFNLPVWDQWKKAIDKQLAHITYSRDRNPKAWTGQENAPLLDELGEAWKKFRRHLRNPYKAEFENKISERLNSEFEGLDLDC